jgi:hypothetical protein
LATIEIYEPKTFEEYVQVIGRVNTRNGGASWYRGADDASHGLTPGLYRKPLAADPAGWASLEENMMLSFSQRSMPFVDRPITPSEDGKDGDWSLLFYMQHFRIPTRLLDWSQSPFVGLFFAATGPFETSSKTKSGKIEFKKDAVVWVLNPSKWNQTAWSNLTYKKGVAFTNEPFLKGYRPPISGRDKNDLPIAMFGAHNNRRIVAQRGAFTISGASTAAMDRQFETYRFPDKVQFTDELSKIILDKTLLPEFRQSLFSYGITDSVIYPDLEGVAHEIKREFGFEE